MRKKISKLLMICAVILPALLIPTVLASKPIPVSGTLYFTPYLDEVRFANGNVILDIHEDVTWTGDIIGSSLADPCRVVIHKANGFPPTDWEFRWYTGIATFEACTVDGKTGGLVMRLTAKDSGPGTEWSGKWVILKATGELEGIHGQGTWSSGTYEGKIHFDPS